MPESLTRNPSGELWYVERGLLEIKHRSTIPPDLPWEVKVQVIVQLAVTKQPWCDVLLWSRQAAPHSYRIHRVWWDDPT